MAESRWIRHGVRIGVVEFRRTVRALRESPLRLFFLCGLSVFFSLLVLGISIITVDELRSISGPVPIHDPIRGIIGMLWLFDTFIIGQRVISQRPRLDAEEIVLTTVSARTAASGLVIAEALRYISGMALPVIIVSGLCVYAFGSPASAVLIPLAVGLFVVSSVIVAHVFGFAGAFLLARSPFIARHKTPIGVFLAFVFFGGYNAYYFLPMLDIGIDSAVLAWLPVGWYIDLAVIGTPVAPSWSNVTGVLITTVAILLVGGYTIERFTKGFWFDAPVDPGDSGTETEPTTDALASSLQPFRLPAGLDTPSRRVAQMIVLRTWRNPSRLSFVLMAVVITGSLLINTIQFGSASVLIPVILITAIPWIVGMLFGLNPLGDSGAVLPATLTASLTGTQFITGIAVPGQLVGIPILIVLTIVIGVLQPYTMVEGLGLSGLGFVLVFMSVRLAPLIGLRFPRFSAISVGQSREVVPPSFVAVVVYSFVTLGLAITGAAALLIPTGIRTAVRLFVGGFIPFVLSQVAVVEAVTTAAAWFRSLGTTLGSIPTLWIQIVGFGGPIVIAIAVADRSLRYAARRFDVYTIE